MQTLATMPTTFGSVSKAEVSLKKMPMEPEEWEYLRLRSVHFQSTGQTEQEVYTTCEIPAYTLVCRYRGEPLSLEQGLAREKQYADMLDPPKQAMLFFRVVDEWSKVVEFPQALDGCKNTTPGPMMNHSDSPNCKVVAVWNQKFQEVWVWIITLRNIKENEALEYRYGDYRPEILEAHRFLKPTHNQGLDFIQRLERKKRNVAARRQEEEEEKEKEKQKEKENEQQECPMEVD